MSPWPPVETPMCIGEKQKQIGISEVNLNEGKTAYHRGPKRRLNFSLEKICPIYCSKELMNL